MDLKRSILAAISLSPGRGKADIKDFRALWPDTIILEYRMLSCGPITGPQCSKKLSEKNETW